MTQKEADQELGRIIREALVKGLQANAPVDLDVAIDVAGVGPVVTRIRIGRLAGC